MIVRAGYSNEMVELGDAIGQAAVVAWDRDSAGEATWITDETCDNGCTDLPHALRWHEGISLLTDGHGTGWQWKPDREDPLTGQWVNLWKR